MDTVGRLVVVVIQVVALWGCNKNGPLVVHTDRAEPVISGVLLDFQRESRVKLQIHYAPASAFSMEDQGPNVDVLVTQDPSPLVQRMGALRVLPAHITDLVPRQFKDGEGHWVGLTGRARVVAYNTGAVSTDDLPTTLGELADPRWRGRVGWVPDDGSFQAFVGAMIRLAGKDKTEAWLEAMRDNESKPYASNDALVAAIRSGEIDLGLSEHDALYRLKAEHGDELGVANHYFKDGGPASLVSPSAAGIVKDSERWQQGEELITYLLGRQAQDRFASESYELPLSANGTHLDYLPAVADLGAPELDRSGLDEEALKLLREAQVLSP